MADFFMAGVMNRTFFRTSGVISRGTLGGATAKASDWRCDLKELSGRSFLGVLADAADAATDVATDATDATDTSDSFLARTRPGTGDDATESGKDTTDAFFARRRRGTGCGASRGGSGSRGGSCSLTSVSELPTSHASSAAGPGSPASKKMAFRVLRAKSRDVLPRVRLSLTYLQIIHNFSASSLEYWNEPSTGNSDALSRPPQMAGANDALLGGALGTAENNSRSSFKCRLNTAFVTIS